MADSDSDDVRTFAPAPAPAPAADPFDVVAGSSLPPTAAPTPAEAALRRVLDEPDARRLCSAGVDDDTVAALLTHLSRGDVGHIATQLERHSADVISSYDLGEVLSHYPIIVERAKKRKRDAGEDGARTVYRSAVWWEQRLLEALRDVGWDGDEDDDGDSLAGDDVGDAAHVPDPAIFEGFTENDDVRAFFDESATPPASPPRPPRSGFEISAPDLEALVRVHPMFGPQ